MTSSIVGPGPTFPERNITVTQPIQITTGTNHHGFTSCAFWHNHWWVAYRTARTHAPAPPGHIVVQRSAALTVPDPDGAPVFHPVFRHAAVLHYPEGTADFRDPRLIADDGVLYCLFGAYLPRYPATTISPRASENLIQSFLTYTEDGTQWAPVQPIGRPGYWIWSAVPIRTSWAAAAYHVGQPGETSSIHLLGGQSLLTLQSHAMIYDGSDATQDGDRLRYGHASVAEPVLYRPTPDTLGCLIRSEDTSLKDMEIGMGMSPYQDWRWHRTGLLIHPSAVLETPHGLLLAGRELRKRNQWDLTTSLYHLDSAHVTLLHRMPSANDTGYAGLCPGDRDDTVLLSYYSQHATPTPYGTPLPGAQVFVAHITVAA